MLAKAPESTALFLPEGKLRQNSVIPEVRVYLSIECKGIGWEWYGLQLKCTEEFPEE